MIESAVRNVLLTSSLSHAVDVILQRLYRIIKSEELVSPHASAMEMIEVVKKREFTKLFQKIVRKVSV